MKRFQCRSFTLLELIISVTIFMMIAVALFAFSSNVADSWGRITVERNRFSELMNLDRAIDSVLTNSIPFVWREMDNDLSTQVPFIVAEPGYLRIAYMHKLNDAEEGAIRFVEFTVEDGDLLAVYTDRPFIEWNEIAEDRRTTSVLATGVESISFLYADWSSDVSDDWAERLFWRDEWETEESERKDIPLAILMTVTWEDGRQESWMRRTMGNSFRERYGTYNLPADNTP